MLAMAATKGLLDHLLMAACEWFLMFWVFIDATLAYSLTKFARYCDLQIPCLLCSRLDHYFDKEEPGSYYHLFCNNHQEDISYLIYCNLHNELVDIREICEDCLHSQTNLECYRFAVDNNSYGSIRTCSCCKRQWRAKPSGQTVIDPNAIGSRCNVTTKPPLPRVTRRVVRSRNGDGSRRIRNRMKNRRKFSLSPGCLSDANLTSDSEFEIQYSDSDDGSFINHPIARGNRIAENRYRILGKHSFSSPDFGSLLFEGQPHESRKIRSSSVTPNVALFSRRSEEIDPLKVMKFIVPSSSSMDGSMGSSRVGSNNSCKISSRHSYSACDLGSALLLEMQLNSLPRRSASVTPNSSSNYVFGAKSQTQPTPNDSVQNNHQKGKKGKKARNSMKKSGSYGHLDDSSISRNNGNQNQAKIPRRHSYSVLQLGCEIMLNMPTDEPLSSGGSYFPQNGSYGFEDPYKMLGQSQAQSQYNPHLQELDALNALLFPLQKPSGYGSWDDSFIPRNTNQYQNHNVNPRRHSYSFFELGCEILLNMPNEESITSRQAPMMITPDPVQRPNKKAKRAKNENSSEFLHKSNGPSSWDDSVISHKTGNQNENGNRNRRHSYSAFELGCALLWEMQKDESLKQRSTNPENPQIVLGLGEQNKTKFQKKSKKRAHDDSIVQLNKGSCDQNQNMLPRRHSYSVFQLGGDILLNMPHDEIEMLTGQTFMTPTEPPQNSIFHIKQSPCHSPEHKSHHQHQHHHHHTLHHNGIPLPQLGHVRRSDHELPTVYLDKNKWHGSIDDSAVYRTMNNQNQNENRRHSVSPLELNRALVEMQLDENLKFQSCYASPASDFPTGHGFGELQQPNFQITPNPSSIERNFNNMPINEGDDSFLARNFNQNQSENPRRHSYSAFELGCALLLDMHIQESMKRQRSASVTPNLIGNYFEDPNNSKVQSGPTQVQQAHPTNGFGSSGGSFYKPNNHEFIDDCAVSRRKRNRKRNRKLARNSYSVSDLTSYEPQNNGGFGSKSATLTPNNSIGEGLGDMNWLKFQAGTNSTPEFNYVDSNQLPHKKRKKQKKKGKRSVQSYNGGNDFYDSSDDPGFGNDTGSSQNRYAIFARNAQSANDLGSVLLEMHLDDSIRSRSKSLTPQFSNGYNSQEENWSKSQTKPSPAHSPTEKHKRSHDHIESERDKKHLPPLIPNKDADSSNHMRNDASSMCSDRMDARSLDGSTYTEIEVDGFIEKVKRKAEDDVRCMRLLQAELEAERNAATIAANHAMNMITRLQQEKAALQMEALQYLRMMEEQAEYDMEALQKANDLVEEKENEIQDLLEELEQYRIRFGDLSMGSIHVPVIIFENEKRYILESISTLDKKLHELTNGDHLNDENNFLTPKELSAPNGAFDNNLSPVEHELLEIKEKIEGLQADIELVKHACNTLHANEGLDFIQEITHQLQDMRRLMLEKRGVPST